MVFRPSTATWYVLLSGSGKQVWQQYGGMEREWLLRATERPLSLRNKSIGKLMQPRFPIDTHDANRQESVLRSHVKLGGFISAPMRDPHRASVREYPHLRRDENGQYSNAPDPNCHVGPLLRADGVLDECLRVRTVAIGSPREMISHCIWLCFRFGVSFRDVEELMAARGVLLGNETVRRLRDKFGKQYAAGLRRRRARTGDKWYLDEVFLKINGVTHYLWRAVDQNGVVLDISRSTKAGSICCHPLLPQAVACNWEPTTRDHYRQAA